jgi:hypothetical protein
LVTFLKQIDVVRHLAEFFDALLVLLRVRVVSAFDQLEVLEELVNGLLNSLLFFVRRVRAFLCLLGNFVLQIFEAAHLVEKFELLFAVHGVEEKGGWSFGVIFVFVLRF